MPRKSKGLVEAEAMIVRTTTKAARLEAQIAALSVERDALRIAIEAMEVLATALRPKPKGATNADV